MMSHIDLCSGIGGFALGFEWAGLSKPVLFCDIEPWSRKILAKHWPHVRIAEDVKELANDPDGFIPDTDPRNTILTAGYPCQPFSQAGKRRGTEDDRHIWPYIREIVAQKRPAWCVLENVYGHVSMGLDEVLSDLEADGYATRPFIVPACSIDAPHRRDRVWIIAHANSESEPNGTKYEQRMVAYARCEHGSKGNATKLDKEQTKWASRTIHPESSGERQSDATDTDGKGLQGQQGQHKPISEQETGHTARNSGKKVRTGNNFWEFEPTVGRVAHGIPRRVDRLKGLGNAIVPQIAQKIGEVIKAQHDRN